MGLGEHNNAATLRVSWESDSAGSRYASPWVVRPLTRGTIYAQEEDNAVYDVAIYEALTGCRLRRWPQGV